MIEILFCLEKAVSDKTKKVSESSDDLENSALICKVCLDRQVAFWIYFLLMILRYLEIFLNHNFTCLGFYPLAPM